MNIPSGALADAATWIAWACAGGLLGAVYFVALRRTVAELAAGTSRWRPLALTVGRLVLATGLMLAAARTGAAPALAALAGFLLVRTAFVRRARSAS